MFLQNKYTKWYFNIINNRTNRSVEGYTESHHIIPKSMGGSNKADNLVNLTPKEHYICHLLLVRMCAQSKHKAKMVYALKAMTMVSKNHQRHTSSIFHIFRTAHFSQLKGENHSRYGARLTDEHKQILSEKAKHQWQTSEATKNRKRDYGWTEEQKEARSKAFKGKKWMSHPETQETKMVLPSEVEVYLNDGWIQGRKFSNPFIGSGTNFREARN